jgi:hypothetical protein
VLQDPGQSLLPADATESVTDTGELKRNWQQGLYTIDTPLTQAATGWLGGRSINLGAIQVIRNPYASVVVRAGRQAIGPVARAAAPWAPVPCPRPMTRHPSMSNP